MLKSIAVVCFSLSAVLINQTTPQQITIMDHPYMDPNYCPWTEEYQESYGWKHAMVIDDESDDLELDQCQGLMMG